MNGSSEIAGSGALGVSSSELGGSPAAEHVHQGTVLAGRFRVEHVLGTGGMGCVVAAWHTDLDKRVAVKLLATRRGDSQRRARLLREARFAARIESDHCVRVLDVIDDAAYGPFIVMECLEGETLAQRLQREPQLDVSTTVQIVLQASEAVAEAHFRGAIHRDLKPSNLFLMRRPGKTTFVKVLDFGISKATRPVMDELTHSHSLLASPAYASPEQLRASKTVDARADIWALGVILYECLTGRRPFVGDTLAEVSSQILRDAPAAARHHRSELPEELDRVVAKCLSKDPSQRFQTVAALMEKLIGFGTSECRANLCYVRELTRVHPDSSASSPTPVQGVTLTHHSLVARVPTHKRQTKARRGWRIGLVGLTASLGLSLLWNSCAAPAGSPAKAKAQPPAKVTATLTSTIAEPKVKLSAPVLAAKTGVIAAPSTAPSEKERGVEKTPRVSSSARVHNLGPPPVASLRLGTLIDERK